MDRSFLYPVTIPMLWVEFGVTISIPNTASANARRHWRTCLWMVKYGEDMMLFQGVIFDIFTVEFRGDY